MEGDARKEEAGTTEDWGLIQVRGGKRRSCNCRKVRLCLEGDQAASKAVIEAPLTAAGMSITVVDLGVGREIMLLS